VITVICSCNKRILVLIGLLSPIASIFNTRYRIHKWILYTKLEMKRSNGYVNILMLSMDRQKHHSHKVASLCFRYLLIRITRKEVNEFLSIYNTFVHSKIYNRDVTTGVEEYVCIITSSKTTYTNNIQS
jgi:hypothetical protein